MTNEVKLTFLGTGTSQGVPIIACDCDVCRSTDSRDKRLRASVLLEFSGKKILVDAGPDFRYQLLRQGVKTLDAIILTHFHKDHTGGLDDVRAFNYFTKKPMDIYCEDRVYTALKRDYAYVFAEEKYPGAPSMDVHVIDENPFTIDGSAPIIPIRGMHYQLPVLGFRFGNIAYLTDFSHIEDSELSKLRGLDYFIINTVQKKPHISHFSLSEAVELCQKVGAKESYLTHLSHRLPRHELLTRELPEGIYPAYDTLTLTSTL